MPSAGRFASPVVETIGDAPNVAQAAQVVIELLETLRITVALVSFFSKFSNVSLDRNHSAGDTNAELRDIKPVGGDDSACAGVELDIVRHNGRIDGAKRVDKAVVCL
jgi:hypothetical protein